MKKQRIPLLLILLILVLYALDQVSKWLIVLHYELPTPYYLDRTPVITGSRFLNFDIVRIHNTGVAFGMGNGEAWAPILFLGVQIFALILLFRLYRRGFFSTRLLKLAWALITVGVLGNMTDRLTQGFFLPGAEQLTFAENLLSGYVVDFLDFSFPFLPTEAFPLGYHWPSFNVADSCVCVAATLFFISCFLPQPGETEKRNKPGEATEQATPEETGKPNKPGEVAEQAAPEEAGNPNKPDEVAEQAAPEEAGNPNKPDEAAEQAAPEETGKPNKPGEAAEQVLPLIPS